jgi:proteic killer suppression protein
MTTFGPCMIRNFADKDAEKIWGGIASRRLPVDIQSVARRKLRMLGNAFVLDDLRIPPANRLEALKGSRKSQHSIRINSAIRGRVHFSRVVLVGALCADVRLPVLRGAIAAFDSAAETVRAQRVLALKVRADVVRSRPRFLSRHPIHCHRRPTNQGTWRRPQQRGSQHGR